MISDVELLFSNGWRAVDDVLPAGLRSDEPWLVHPVLLPQSSVEAALRAQAAYDRELFSGNGYVDSETLLSRVPSYACIEEVL